MLTELRFTTVETFTSPWEAHICRGLLESEGITAYVSSEHHIGLFWPMSQALGGVRVRVREEHAAQAMQVLAQRNQGQFESAVLDQEGNQSLVCRSCGATQFKEVRVSSAIALAVAFLFVGSAIFPPPKRTACVACGGDPDNSLS
jgi:hypothetical protein